MHFDPFRNKWAALALVGVITLGAATLVGSEERGGPLDFAARQPVPQRSGVAETIEPREGARSPEFMPSEPEFSEPAEITERFDLDAELIDSAEGLDATPMTVHDGPDESGSELEAEGETSILPSDAEGSES